MLSFSVGAKKRRWRLATENKSIKHPIRQIILYNGHDNKVKIERSSACNQVFKESIRYLQPAYYFVEGNASVLSWWFRDEDTVLVTSSLSTTLDLSADERLWQINISGMFD